jgi:arginyl-tRNA synthetase
MFEQERRTIETQIRDYCIRQGLPEPDEFAWSPIPFEGEWGISTSFFQLAAKESRHHKEAGGKSFAIPQRAQEIATAVAQRLGKPAGFSHIEAVRGYLNLYFSPSEYSRQVVETVGEKNENYGHGAAKGKRIMVEFSQPNTHKAFHVGHLRSAILGDVLSRILEFSGYKVVRANYLGDIGLHVIKWLWNYMKYHAGELPPTDTTRWMGDLYAEAVRRLEDNPELEADVRTLYARWDQRETDVFETWQRTRQWSLDGFNEMYKVLDIHFDRFYANSEVEQPGKKIVEELISQGIAQDERPDGPVIVKIDEQLGLEKEKYRVLVVLRSDGTALYATEDLALAKLKFQEYPDLACSIYVVDVRQALHFQQVFKTLEIAGFSQADRCMHLSYELVNLPGNVVMASREGTVVLLEKLIHEAIQRAQEVVEEKNPDLKEDEKQLVARAVGLGALKYPMLARDHSKIVTFDWESALDFNGQAAPYIQYAHVRANSILKRAQTENINYQRNSDQSFDYPLHLTEIQLIDLISRFPDEVQRAAKEYRTLHITNYAYELAKAFTDFYNACPVLKAEPDVRLSRLQLVVATRQTIANALNLLGIQAPQVM